MPISFVRTPQHYMNACAPSEAGWDTCPSPSHASGTWIEPHDAASSTVVFWGDSMTIELYAATLCRLGAAGTSKYYDPSGHLAQPQLLNLTQEAALFCIFQKHSNRLPQASKVGKLTTYSWN